MNRLVNKWLKIVQHLPRYCLPLPCQCVLCLQPTKRDIALCLACEENRLPWIKNACERCGIGIKEAHQLCGQCLKESPPFDKLSALFEYAWPVNAFIAKLKYSNQLAFGKMLGSLMAKHLKKSSDIDCVLALPLHPNRQKQRGFNQSYELASSLCAHSQLPFDRWSCTKLIDTPSQALLSAKQRITLGANAFAISPDFKAQHVLVIDDVVTTCSTVNAFSHALKKHGVKTVEIWSVCRTQA